MQNEITTLEDRPATQSTPLFSLGHIYATPGAIDALSESGQLPDEFLRRHQTGDWGEVCDADNRENKFSIANGFRILSAYRTSGGTNLWVITEADRSVTTLLLPSEY
ncbi:MAG TPA: hypothetical protein VEX70_16490 [Pyrinomonadaceae bacterium]|nr:hypothetical protein [Pyrinomonadaceae bacterium]